MSDPVAARVFLVDDHPMWRQAVEADLTAQGLEVVGTAADVASATRRIPAVSPDVVLLDLQLPDGTGVDVTEALAESCPRTRVLILSASGEPADVLAAVKAGALGYLVKSVASSELVEAVLQTARGEAVFSPGLAGLVLGEFRKDRPVGDAKPSLTKRETEVLRFVAKGLSYKEIAARLGISHRTIQNHVQNTLVKLQLNNRVELTRYAVANGLEDPADG